MRAVAMSLRHESRVDVGRHRKIIFASRFRKSPGHGRLEQGPLRRSHQNAQSTATTIRRPISSSSIDPQVATTNQPYVFTNDNRSTQRIRW